MTGKQKYFIGYNAVAAPESSAVVVSSGTKRARTESFETQNSSKILYKYNGGGGSSSKFTKSYKAGDYVDNRSGKHGFKEEVKYNSCVKFNDKIKGCKTEYETQVKFKKVTTYNDAPKKIITAPKSSSSSNNKSITYNAPKNGSSTAAPKSTATFKCMKYTKY